MASESRTVNPGLISWIMVFAIYLTLLGVVSKLDRIADALEQQPATSERPDGT